jgi:hypothetical protein
MQTGKGRRAAREPDIEHGEWLICMGRRFPLPKSASSVRAEFKSRFPSGFAAEFITREFPQMADKMYRGIAMLNRGSRLHANGRPRWPGAAALWNRGANACRATKTMRDRPLYSQSTSIARKNA